MQSYTAKPRYGLEILGVGPQKTTTSWLAEALMRVDTLSFPREVKETFFWDKNFNRGEKWYFDHFSNKGTKIEFGPTYFHSLDAIQRLRAHNPNLKVIITLRDPAARSFSLYLHHLRKGRVTDDFFEAISKYPEIIEASRYHKYVPKWVEAFGSSRVLVLLQDEVQSDPIGLLEKVGGFIDKDFDSKVVNPEKIINASGYPRSVRLAKFSTQVAEFLRNRNLYKIINIGKMVGLKSLSYGGASNRLPKLEPYQRAKLIQGFDKDIRFVEEYLSVNLATWREL